MKREPVLGMICSSLPQPQQRFRTIISIISDHWLGVIEAVCQNLWIAPAWERLLDRNQCEHLEVT